MVIGFSPANRNEISSNYVSNLSVVSGNDLEIASFGFRQPPCFRSDKQLPHSNHHIPYQCHDVAICESQQHGGFGSARAGCGRKENFNLSPAFIPFYEYSRPGDRVTAEDRM